MSILIKNIKMPARCELCPFSGISGISSELVSCTFTGKYRFFDDGQYFDDCPLIEVSTPHGRLIDADALDIRRREQQAWQDYEHNPDNEYLEGVKDGLHEASKQLSTAMTIIEAEEDE